MAAGGAPAAARAEIAYHALPVERVLASLDASPSGLATPEALRRLAQHGPNRLPVAKQPGPIALLLRQLRSPIIYVLLASAAVAFALGRLVDGIVVVAVVAANALLGFVQERSALAALASLVDLVPETVSVLRDGHPVARPAEELVPGDVVLLQPGDKVPADMRVLSAERLQADEAPLTGESVPVAKVADPAPREAPVADRRSMIYGGTLIAAGAGKAVVTGTGAATELGRINALLATAHSTETPLTRSLDRLGGVVSAVILGVAAVIVGVALVRGYPPVDALLSGVSLAVAAIPEGLPAIITIALSIGVRRMVKRRAIVRRLPAVETLGSTSVVCTDKTGTLTRNEMTVKAISTHSGDYALSGVGYAPDGDLLRDGAPVADPPPDVIELLRAGVLCSDAVLRGEGGDRTVVGDPTEAALVVAAEKAGIGTAALRGSLPRAGAIPFDPAHRFMATLHRTPSAASVAYVKGAPEVLLPRCDGIDAARVHAEVEAMAARGMRVLALAVRDLDGAALDEAAVASGLRLLGLAGMIDPPRPEAASAVRACQRAGIAVKMITGDHRETARAIGRELGILGEGDVVVTGAEISARTDEELRAVAAGSGVFARIAPEHKLRLVRALQAERRVVAMTGDGVNDAPALRQADIGVAMGMAGTSAAKEAADIVLTDDDFATLRAAVEEGRRVYDNLVKALVFVLPTNLAQAMMIVVAVIALPIADGVPLMPMVPVQILWINLVTSVGLSLPLAFEAPEPNAMERPPRPANEPILGRPMLLQTAVVGAAMTAGTILLFLYEHYVEIEAHLTEAEALREAQTEAVTTLILYQVFYLLTCRSLRGSSRAIGLLSNPLVYIGIAVVVALQVTFVEAAPMNAVFGSAPLPYKEWLESAAVAATILPVAIAAKRWAWRREACAR